MSEDARPSRLTEAASRSEGSEVTTLTEGARANRGPTVIPTGNTGKGGVQAPPATQEVPSE